MTGFDRRRTPARDDLAAAHLQGKVAAPRYVEGRRMRVADEAIALRARPSHDCSLDTQALHGEAVVVYDVEEGWAWGQLESDGYVGYMPADSLIASPLSPTHRVVVPRTILYPGPDLKTPAAGALPMGAQVELRGLRGDYAQTSSGLFVFAAHLAPLDARCADFVAAAEAFVGAPYLWGGKTWLGLDCSGLVQVALAAAGVAAPRDTDMMQAELGGDLPAAAGLRRGDLVFWKGHVGIMQDADRLLHANGHHMQVASEPFAEARARIAAKSFGEIVAVRRLSI
jgi:cell wall-associated NlpC family hydrolase